MTTAGLTEGAPVILYLQAPKERIWGLLISLQPAGVVLRGLELSTFDDWMRQEARGEECLIGLGTVFYPMHRVVRLERDESIGPFVSYADRFAQEVGKSIADILGLPAPDED